MALHKARSAYYSFINIVNKNNSAFPVYHHSLVDKAKPSISAYFSSEDFMSFFTNKITEVR